MRTPASPNKMRPSSNGRLERMRNTWSESSASVKSSERCRLVAEFAKNKKRAPKDAGWSQTLRAKRCVCIETLWALLREASRNLTGRRRLTDSEFVQSRSNLPQISLKTCAFHDTNQTHDAHFTMHDLKHARRGFCEAHTRRIRSSLESCTHPRELHTMHHACREPRDE